MNHNNKIFYKPRNAGAGYFESFVLGSALRIVFQRKYISLRVSQVAEILNFQRWIVQEFGSIRIRNSRIEVWQDITKNTGLQEFRGIEFGVAWGYLTWWWFKNYNKQILRWDGFDSFRGLPRKWRNFPEGTFDTRGERPAFRDDRIVWHVGNIADTTGIFQIERDANIGLVIFFDLDIFEPSLIAWNNIKPYLRKNDVLYFDEAFDEDEGTLLRNYVLPSGKFEIISTSWTSLAIRITEILE